MRQETEGRLKTRAAKVAGYRSTRPEGRVEDEVELHLAKMEYRIEQMADNAPAPLTAEHRDRLCNFLASLP